MKNSNASEIAKEKGLPEFTTKQLIDLMKIEMLYTTYKDVSDIIVLEPVKPIKPSYPVEPMKPVSLSEPTLKTISGSSKEIETINIELFKEYQSKKIEYEKDILTYQKKISKYQKDMAIFEMEKSEYPKNIEKYESNVLKYNKEKAKYDKFIAQKKINDKIKSTYTKWTGKEWNSHVKSDKMTYFMLVGPPGHGKTTVFRQSAKLVASELGLVYKENPTVNDTVDINSFVLYVNNLAGEVSKIGTAGLPSKVKDEDGNEYTGLLPSYSMSALTKAGAGVLLLDDLANASSFIQNIALPLTNENSFNELKLDGIYVGITANLGALDGTNTSKISSALRNRVKVVFTQDDVDDFIMRARKNVNYMDDIGDFFITDFLENKKNDKDYMDQLFYTIPNQTGMGGFSNPRSLDSTINEIRRIIYDQGGLNEENKDIIKLTMMSTLGKNIGEDLFGYIEDVQAEIAPIIDTYFNEGKLDLKKIKKKTADSFAMESKLFEYKFRKYLEKKIRSEAFKVMSLDSEPEIKKSIDSLFDKIGRIFPLLNEQQRGSLSASLREDVFFGIKTFSEDHPVARSGENLKLELKKEIIEKINQYSKGKIDEAYKITMTTLFGENANLDENIEAKPPTSAKRKLRA